MITLFTGLPGAGKTLLAIKECMDLERRGRNVYCHGVDGLQIHTWADVDANFVLKWHETLPANGVLLIDEVQQRLAPQRTKPPVPEWITELQTHRHKGVDFVLTAQNPLQFDVELRRLVGRHIHLERKFNKPQITAYEWSRCITDPNDRREYRDAAKSLVRLDPAVFDLYKSTEQDTHKFRLPFRLWLAIGAAAVAFIALPIGGYFFYDKQIANPGDRYRDLAAEDDEFNRAVEGLGVALGGGSSASSDPDAVQGLFLPSLGLTSALVIDGYHHYNDEVRFNLYDAITGVYLSDRDLATLGYEILAVNDCLLAGRAPEQDNKPFIATCPRPPRQYLADAEGEGEGRGGGPGQGSAGNQSYSQAQGGQATGAAR